MNNEKNSVDATEVKTSWFKTHWHLIVIPILCVALIIALIVMTLQKAEVSESTISTNKSISASTSTPTVSPITSTTPTETPIIPETTPIITHNPTNETRNLGTEWVYDASRNMKYNTSYPMYFLVEGLNYDSIQWYIYSDHDSPASNYWGVSGDKTKMVAVTPRTDMNGYGIYAVLTDSKGNSIRTSMAYMYITAIDQPVVTYYTVTCSNCVADYTQAEAGTVITITPPARHYQIDVYNSLGVNIASSSNNNTFSFSMPNDNIRVVATPIGEEPVSSYSIQIWDNGEGGYTSADKYSAMPGDLITLTLTPTNSQANYTVVTSTNGQAVQHTMSFPYITFTMPTGDVDVTVTWSIP